MQNSTSAGTIQSLLCGSFYPDENTTNSQVLINSPMFVTVLEFIEIHFTIITLLIQLFCTTMAGPCSSPLTSMLCNTALEKAVLLKW